MAGSANPGTQGAREVFGEVNVGSIGGTIPLPTGAATEAKQDTGNTSLSAINSKITAVNTGAVVIASGTVTAVTAITNALPAGANNIGDVDVLTMPADPFGVNADAASATGSISAKLRFIAVTGIPITGTVTVASHAVTNAGTFLVQENGAHIIVDDAAFTPATSKVVMAGFEADESSTDSVDEGDAGAARMTLDRKIITNPQPHTSGGLTVFRSLDMDETEEEVKATPGCLYKLRITNRTTSVRYVKLYNDTAANVTVGTTTPMDTIPIPSNASDYTVLTESFGGIGLTFSVALCIAATTGLADNDTGAPGTNDIVLSAYYK